LAVQGGNSYLYHYLNNADVLLAAAEIALVGTFTGATLTGTDFGVLAA
jgi:hypothetical protein